MLDLEQPEVDLFRGRSRWPPSPRVFGGEVAAQALVAAGRTVPDDRAVHSLHAYFLRPGDASRPIVYDVERVRDGGSFTTRRVTARQRGEVTFALSASFSMAHLGDVHQVPVLAAPSPRDLPGPDEAMVGTDEPARQWFSGLAERHPFDLRFSGELPFLAVARGERAEPVQRFWLRSRELLGDEQLAHSCAATYASDMLLLSTSVALHGARFGARRRVREPGPRRVVPRALPGGRLAVLRPGEQLGRRRPRHLQGRMFDPRGRLVATVMQEGMVRRRPPTR
jgi:acyl-CoA thioesterase-2